MYPKSITATVVAAASIFGLSSLAFAENGVSDSEIIFGQTAAIEGPASALGIGMRDGLMAAFAEANAAGGVNGRQLKLVTLNDGYEPDTAISNINTLINDTGIFAHIGAVGTPTSKAIAPIACDAGVPFIGPFTGAGFLRDMDCVVNMRGTYCQEAETWVRHLTEDLSAQRIAILYQDDSFGRVGLDCTEQALSKRNMELVGSGTYERNTTAVKSAVLKIRKAKPDAVVTVGAYKPIAEFIKTARSVKMTMPILNISFTGSKALAAELGDQTDNVIITQVVPFPFDSSIPLVAEYQAALTSLDSSLEPGFVSLEGYLVGRTAIQALQSAGSDVTREAFLQAFTGTHDLGGAVLTYDMPSDNQGMDDIFLTTINSDASFNALSDLSSLN